MNPPIQLRSCPAPAKVNLYLHVLGRRDNGYHDIETVFDLLDLQDTLHFRVRNDGAIMRRGTIHGLAYDSDLSVRAARLLAGMTETRFGADIDVIKRIPVGGGLGGGSSNAATTLLALNRLWNINWPIARLARLGLQLGADVPVFIHGTAAHATGVGEKIAPLSLPTQWYVLVAPLVSVPTADIFSAPELTRDSKPLKISPLSRSQVGALGRNDLEPVACKRFPPVLKALDALNRAARAARALQTTAKAGNVGRKAQQEPGVAASEPTPESEAVAWSAARMSGSGSCVFLPVVSREVAERVRDKLGADVGKVFVLRSIKRHPLRNWAFGRRS